MLYPIGPGGAANRPAPTPKEDVTVRVNTTSQCWDVYRNGDHVDTAYTYDELQDILRELSR